MLGELARHGLFQQVGTHETAPVTFSQPIDDYIEAYHSRSGFARERMGAERAAASDLAASQILHAAYPDGVIRLQVSGQVIWGLPGG